MLEDNMIEVLMLPILQGSPDLKAAKEVADYLGTVHHELHFTVQVHYLLFFF
jgi:asparagine synthetase B (glutamine-hydrolysing)